MQGCSRCNSRRHRKDEMILEVASAVITVVLRDWSWKQGLIYCLSAPFVLAGSSKMQSLVRSLELLQEAVTAEAGVNPPERLRRAR